MDGIVALLTILILIGSLVGRARSLSQKRPGRASAPAARPAQEARPLQERRPARRQTAVPQKKLPPELRSAFEKARTQAAPAQSEGASRVAEDGCVGGSLPHEEAHPPKPARPAPEAATAPMPRAQQAPAISALGAVDAAQMRRAVVMAEVLARPVSLRPRGYRL